MNAALHYEVEAFDTSRAKLMGRHAAGEGFLRGYARHASTETLLCHTRAKKDFADFVSRVEKLAGRPRACRWIPYGNAEGLAQAGCLFYPAPNVGELAWRRRFHGPRSYSVCGITHTIATQGVMDSIGQMLVAPLQHWDALICTSRVAKAVIEQVHAQWAAYLDEKFAGHARCPIEIPVIPLGVDSGQFAPSAATGKMGADLRKRYGIADDDVAVLFAGRLSYHAKAHPMPMYLGLEDAAKRTQKRIHLIQAGRFPNEAIEQQFVAGAKTFCPSVRTIFLDGRDAESWAAMWHAADIFTSLSDNIQETFGLAPLEAMAAGLPVVVSDWDGYRDTVRHGVDGIAIPTFMPAPGAGEAFAYRHFMDFDNYDHYIGHISQCTGVDVRACGEAFTALVGDPALRRRMGNSGRARAQEQYDWRVIVAAYEALWDELAQRRKAESEIVARRAGAPAHPLRDDPFSVFASFASLAVGPETIVLAMPDASEAGIDRARSIRMNDYAAELLAPIPETKAMLARLLAMGPMSVASLIAGTHPRSSAALLRSLSWLGKMGLVRFESPGVKRR